MREIPNRSFTVLKIPYLMTFIFTDVLENSLWKTTESQLEISAFKFINLRHLFLFFKSLTFTI